MCFVFRFFSHTCIIQQGVFVAAEAIYSDHFCLRTESGIWDSYVLKESPCILSRGGVFI